MLLKYNDVQKYLESHFKTFKNAVINELIDYYGEEYKDIILSRIKDTNFIFYINPKFNDFLMYTNKKKSNYKWLKDYYKSIKREIKKYKLGSGEIYNSKSTDSDAFSLIVKNNLKCFYMYNNSENRIKREIFIPIFYGSDEAIIHEIIHSVMSTPLVLCSNENEEELKYKFGIGLENDKGENLLEECMTVIDSRIILNRLKSKKISFLDKYYLFEDSGCSYDNFVPYVNELYKLYKNEINEARITLNSRKFIYSIGKENYCEFISFLHDFREYYHDVEKIYYINHLQQCISNIKEYRKENPLILSKN